MNINCCRTLAAASILVFAGCASVKVYKVNVDAQGREMVDKSVEGIPYYMPRPWVEVYEPFVVDTSPYFVTAQLTPDGKYLRLASLPAGLNDPCLSELIAMTPVASGTPVQFEGKTGVGIDATNAAAQVATDATKVLGNGNSGGNSPTNNSSASPSTNAPASKAGLASMKVTSTADFYITPGRRFFDIVYLPDYSDKRIIRVRGGLGQANLSVTLAQGWSLAAMNATVDNTELAKELFKTWDTALQLAQKAATMTFPPAGMLQGAAVANGTQITCKLIDSTMVAPGLYPLPKNVEYPQPYGATRPNLSFVDHLGLKTYHVYTVQALTPTGDSPLNFTLYGSEAVPSGSVKAGVGATAPLPAGTEAVDFDALSRVLTNCLATDPRFAPYAALVKNANAVSGSTPTSVVFTLDLKSLPSDQTTSNNIAAAALPIAQDVAKRTPPAATVDPPIKLESEASK